MTHIKIFKKVHTFKLEELDGKTLKIMVGKDTQDGVETTVVIGHEEKTDIKYILNSESKVIKCQPKI